MFPASVSCVANTVVAVDSVNPEIRDAIVDFLCVYAIEEAVRKIHMDLDLCVM